MTKQTSKAQLLKDIITERRRLEKNLANLSAEEMIQPGVTGDWSTKDILAHLAAWEKLFLDWYRAGVEGHTTTEQPVGMCQRAMDEVNEEVYKNNRESGLEKVQAEFLASYQQILAVIEVIPEEDMFARERYRWTGELTLADYIAGNTCNHYAWAKGQVWKWRRKRAVS